MSVAPQSEPFTTEALSGGEPAKAWEQPRILDLTLLGSALALFITLFFPWYHVSATSGNGLLPAGVSVNANAWDSFDSMQIFLCLFAILLAAVAAWELLTASPRGAHWPRFSALPLAAVFAGGLSALLTFIHLFSIPDQGALAALGFSISLSWGIFVALLAALVATAAAVQLAMVRGSFERAATGFRSLGSAAATEIKSNQAGGQATTGTSTPLSSRPQSEVEELERLSQLRRSGALTEEEFAAAKQRLLGHAPNQDP